MLKIKLPPDFKTISPDQPAYLEGLLDKGGFWLSMLVFFGLGLLLSLTPCVLPMIPILSSLIIGQAKNSPGRSFSLAFFYVLGMALSYAFLGFSVSWAGNSLQASLQKPWIIGLFAGLIALMGFSLLGWFNLQLPQVLRGAVAKMSHHQKQGSYAGTFSMGVLSTLILSPCVTPALASALLYIAKTGNTLLGASALFSLGWGAGLPLLVVGASSNKFLPRSGPWMNGIKIFLGFMLLATAISTLARILPGQITMILWSLLAIGLALVLRTFSSASTRSQYLGKALGLFFFVYGILLILGAFLGQKNPLQPLPLNSSRASELGFHQIRSLAELTQQLHQAKLLHRPLLLDFYADWCVECHKMDAYTFSDPQVQALLRSYWCVRADVTQNSPENQALEREYGIIAPPSLIFFDPEGRVLKGSKIVGDVSAKQLITHLEQQLVN